MREKDRKERERGGPQGKHVKILSRLRFINISLKK